MGFDIQVLRDEVIWIVVLGVITFNLLARSQTHTLVAIIVMAAFAYVAHNYLQQKTAKIEAKQKNDATFVDQEGAWRKEAASDRFFVATFPKKGFQYLKQNQIFMEIAKDVVILRMFDRARYADLLLYLDRLQKVYMYILDGRYYAKSYVSTFMDLRESVLEILYSMTFVVPKSLKHVYGLDPYKVIEENIDRFTVTTRTMIEVLRSFTHKTAKEPHFPETLPQASDRPFDPHQARRLP